MFTRDWASQLFIDDIRLGQRKKYSMNSNGINVELIFCLDIPPSETYTHPTTERGACVTG
jgi:hypothetical protein